MGTEIDEAELQRLHNGTCWQGNRSSEVGEVCEATRWQSVFVNELAIVVEAQTSYFKSLRIKSKLETKSRLMNWQVLLGSLSVLRI